MSSVRPLELAISIDLRLIKMSPVNEPFVGLDLAGSHLPLDSLDHGLSPLLVPFACDVTRLEHATNLNRTPVQLLDAIAAHLIPIPVASVLRAVLGLTILSKATEETTLHVAFEYAPICKCLDTSALWEVLYESALNLGPICIGQNSRAILYAILPRASIHCAIFPLAGAFSSHFTLEPVTHIFPALIEAEEHTLTCLISILVSTLVKVSIGPLANTMAIRESIDKVAYIDLAFG